MSISKDVTFKNLSPHVSLSKTPTWKALFVVFELCWCQMTSINSHQIWTIDLRKSVEYQRYNVQNVQCYVSVTFLLIVSKTENYTLDLEQIVTTGKLTTTDADMNGKHDVLLMFYCWFIVERNKTCPCYIQRNNIMSISRC